jgi:hypothetical protein
MKNLYITHCSEKKDDGLKSAGKKVTPDKLYTAKFIQRFIVKCREKNVDWAILSDKHGMIFPSDKISWYNLSPSDVMKNYEKKRKLLQKLYGQLKAFDKVLFYHNPGRFHALYKYLVYHLIQKGINIKMISHLSEIK